MGLSLACCPLEKLSFFFFLSLWSQWGRVLLTWLFAYLLCGIIFPLNRNKARKYRDEDAMKRGVARLNGLISATVRRPRKVSAGWNGDVKALLLIKPTSSQIFRPDMKERGVIRLNYKKTSTAWRFWKTETFWVHEANTTNRPFIRRDGTDWWASFTVALAVCCMFPKLLQAAFMFINTGRGLSFLK